MRYFNSGVAATHDDDWIGKEMVEPFCWKSSSPLLGWFSHVAFIVVINEYRDVEVVL